MSIVEVCDVIKEYPLNTSLRQMIRNRGKRPTKRVLDGVSLAVEPGEVVGVLGSNGVGKTTLLKVLAGLVQPDSGVARVCGQDVTRAGGRVRSMTAYSFTDDRSFYWRLTGRENLEFFAALDDLHGRAARSRIDELSERLGLGGYIEQPFATYSAGVRQRFALARALLSRVQLLLLDEPTRSVDPTESRVIWSLVRSLSTEHGMTIILVTHRAEEAEAVCDRTAVLVQGKIQAELRTSDLQQAMHGLRGLTIVIDDASALELPRLRELPGVRDATLSRANGHHELEVWCDNEEMSLPELITAITAAGVTIRAFSRAAPLKELVDRLTSREVTV